MDDPRITGKKTYWESKGQITRQRHRPTRQVLNVFEIVAVAALDSHSTVEKHTLRTHRLLYRGSDVTKLVGRCQQAIQTMKGGASSEDFAELGVSWRRGSCARRLNQQERCYQWMKGNMR